MPLLDIPMLNSFSFFLAPQACLIFFLLFGGANSVITFESAQQVYGKREVAVICEQEFFFEVQMLIFDLFIRFLLETLDLESCDYNVRPTATG